MRIWEEATFGNKKYTQDHGEALYRRSMYTFWKRTSPPPSMMAFDAPSRETCTARRARTNTPLQALVLMNDEQYVEAARKLAERVLASGSSSVEERLTLAFRLVLARSPKAPELKALGRLLEQELATYQADSSAAEKLITVGESTRRSELSAAELAAWTAVASVLLNLDETVTKG